MLNKKILDELTLFSKKLDDYFSVESLENTINNEIENMFKKLLNFIKFFSRFFNQNCIITKDLIENECLFHLLNIIKKGSKVLVVSKKGNLFFKILLSCFKSIASEIVLLDFSKVFNSILLIFKSELNDIAKLQNEEYFNILTPEFVDRFFQEGFSCLKKYKNSKQALELLSKLNFIEYFMEFLRVLPMIKLIDKGEIQKYMSITGEIHSKMFEQLIREDIYNLEKLSLKKENNNNFHEIVQNIQTFSFLNTSRKYLANFIRANRSDQNLITNFAKIMSNFLLKLSKEKVIIGNYENLLADFNALEQFSLFYQTLLEILKIKYAQPPPIALTLFSNFSYHIFFNYFKNFLVFLQNNNPENFDKNLQNVINLITEKLTIILNKFIFVVYDYNFLTKMPKEKEKPIKGVNLKNYMNYIVAEEIKMFFESINEIKDFNQIIKNWPKIHDVVICLFDKLKKIQENNEPAAKEQLLSNKVFFFLY